MPIPSITELQKIFSGQQLHCAYQECKEKYEKLKLHANGECPSNLIHERRPNESLAIQTYRKKIYVPKTKNPIGKVLTELCKIRRSSDWSIQHPSDIPKSINSRETLQQYCDKDFPLYESVENFMFTVWMKEYALSGNTVCALIPENTVVVSPNYVKPVARIFATDKVIVPPEMGYVVLEDEVELYSVAGTVIKKTKIFHVLDETGYYKFQQIQGEKYQQMEQYKHNIGELPAWKVKGQYLKTKAGIIIYDARLDPMVSSLDEAAREYSDLQAEVVQHVHSEKYIYTNQECLKCKGSGEISMGKECETCKGKGFVVNMDPYANTIITPNKANENTVPTPPIGYVKKEVEIVKIQDERVANHISDALSGVSMEYLAQVPLQQSGAAKTVDRESLNNFVYAVAEDMVWNMMRIYYFCSEYRYNVIISDREQRMAMLPKIAIPQYFDLLGATYYLEKLTKATSAKLNPAILAALERDYVSKEFYNSPEVHAMFQLIYELDPLPGKSVDEKMTMLSNKAVTQQDFVISSYIIDFVKRAMEADKDFAKKNLPEQRTVLQGFADEKIKAMSVAEKITIPVKPDPNAPVA